MIGDLVLCEHVAAARLTGREFDGIFCEHNVPEEEES